MTSENCLAPVTINGIQYPCGKCPYCKAKRQMMWTLRGKHEGLNKKKLFITLTYNKQNLQITAKYRESPKDEGGTLVRKDLTNFFKRLRKYIYPRKIKYIACGEYGTGKIKGKGDWRPHYHAIIYNISNKELTQKELTAIWGKGFAYIDRKPFVDTKAIAYTVGYINKKMTDSHGWEHYEGNRREPPFQTQSQGIGLEWSKKNPNWYLNLQTGLNGKNCTVPRYYIKKVFEEEGGKIKLDNTIINARDCNNTHYELIGGDLFNGQFLIDGRTIATESHISHQYKVFVNPDGEKTQHILQLLHEKGLKNIELTKSRYNMSELEYAKLRAHYEAEHAQKIIRYRQEWQDYCTLSKEELKSKYEHTTVRFVNRFTNSREDIFPIEYKTIISEAIHQAVEKNAHLKELHQSLNRKGIEISETIDKFCLTFK